MARPRLNGATANPSRKPAAVSLPDLPSPPPVAKSQLFIDRSGRPRIMLRGHPVWLFGAEAVRAASLSSVGVSGRSPFERLPLCPPVPY